MCSSSISPDKCKALNTSRSKIVDILKTGDIAVWRSSTIYDRIFEVGFRLPSYHVGVILKGPIFEDLSDCGKSPTDTYVTYFVNKVTTFENLVANLWFRPNGTSLHLINRITGKDISQQRAYKIWQKYSKLKCLPFYHTAMLAVTSYFRVGGIYSDTYYEKYRYHLCPSSCGYVLHKFGYIRDDAIIANLLPIDFFELKFYQTEKYQRITIFNKHHCHKGLFTGFMERLSLIKFTPICNDLVNEILEEWDESHILTM